VHQFFDASSLNARGQMVARIEHRIIDGVESKFCGKCKTYKACVGDGSRFGKSQAWDGLRPTCKDCLHAHNMDTKEARHTYNAAYWKRTMDSQKEKHKKWRSANVEHRRDYNRKWRMVNGKEYDKKEWQKRKHDEAYRLKFNEYYKEWCKRQRRDNPQYKIKHNISRRLREILHKKDMKTIEYVGCSMLQLQCHLERQFHEYMTWKNQGSHWDLDHIIPCTAFDMTNPVERRACWHYKNLQPLWSGDNIRKSNICPPGAKEAYIKLWVDFFI
jgi:hypothetical protein